MYLTNGAPAAEEPIVSSSAARETPDASPSTSASAINSARPAMTRLIASFTMRACSPSPTTLIVRPDREQHRLGALESSVGSRDDEAQVPGAHDSSDCR